MIQTFEFSTAEQLLFGDGTVLRLGEICKNLGVKRAFVACDAFFLENASVKNALETFKALGIAHFVFKDYSFNPTYAEAERACAFISEHGCDACIGIGGGSSMDIAKAAALLAKNPPPVAQYVGVEKVPNRALPVICVPTTAGTGSEVTFGALLKDDVTHVKGGILSHCIKPAYSIVDPVLTCTMPAALTASSGFDALTHAIEGLTSRYGNPMTHLFARKSIELLGKWLPVAVYNGLETQARYNVMLGSMYAGFVVANAKAALNHAMAYPIEGKYHVSHGEANAALLPYVVRFNMVGCLERSRELAESLGEMVHGLSDYEAAVKAADCLYRLSKQLKIPSIAEIGVKEGDLADFADITLSPQMNRLVDPNPRKPTKQDVIDIYRAAMQA